MKRTVSIGVALKGAMLLAGAVILAGCSESDAGAFTTAECEAFVGKFHQVTGTTSATDFSLSSTEYVQGCMSGEMGLSREELDCGIGAAGVEEWKACNIVFNP